MYRAVPKLLALVGVSLLLTSCAGKFSRVSLQELEVVRDPCPDASATILHLGPGSKDVADASFRTATVNDFNAGMAALGEIETLTTASVTPDIASFAPARAVMAAAARSLQEDRAFLSFATVRHVESVERGAVGSTAAQAYAASAGGAAALHLSRDSWRDSANEIWNATISDGWGSAAVASFGQLQQAQAARLSAQGVGMASATREEQLLLAKAYRRSLLYLYFKAYFRNGRILSISVTSDALKRGLKDRLAKTIKDDTLRKAVEADIGEVADGLVKEICKDAAGKCLALGLIGETTFVTRAGKSYGFPGIDATVDPFADKKISTNKIDKEAVIGDLVRVFFEAIGDTVARVPAVENSTLCKEYQANCATEAENKLLPDVDSIADKVEAGTTALTGVAIRGGWLLSLNNDALATAIQTGVGVTFRKAAEKAAWSVVSKKCPAISGAPFKAISLNLSR